MLCRDCSLAHGAETIRTCVHLDVTETYAASGPADTAQGYSTKAPSLVWKSAGKVSKAACCCSLLSPAVANDSRMHSHKRLLPIKPTVMPCPCAVHTQLCILAHQHSTAQHSTAQHSTAQVRQDSQQWSLTPTILGIRQEQGVITLIGLK